MPDPILELRDVKTHFPIQHGFILKRHIGTVRAVDNVTLSVERGEVLGLVGESGCGKSTLARILAGIRPPTSGDVLYNGRALASLTAREAIATKLKTQMIFQDPYASLSP